MHEECALGLGVLWKLKVAMILRPGGAQLLEAGIYCGLDILTLTSGRSSSKQAKNHKN